MRALLRTSEVATYLDENYDLELTNSSGDIICNIYIY